MRVVFDAVVFVRSLLNPHGSSGKLVFAHADDYELVVSEPVVREILDVLSRPEITRRIRSIADMDLRRLLDIFSTAEIVEPADIPPVCRDPNDDKFLATAIGGNAALLVSADKDLLDLGAYQGIKIVDVATLLELLEERNSA